MSNIRAYLADIGRRGGTKSRRTLDSETAKEMVRLREARRAYRTYYALCFWSFRADLVITRDDIPWVVEQLQKHGNRAAWLTAAKLSR
jgi:hypothetical protein